MSDDPDRKPFLDKYFQFLDECGTPLNQVPTISKVPVDLYRLYMLVKERGGYQDVTKSKMWKDCAQLCNIANSSSASYTLRKQYMKHLLAFECKFDLGGIDVGSLLSAADVANVNRKKSTAQSKLTNSGRSTPTTPRLSPNDSPSGPIGSGGGPPGPPGSYHPGHHPGHPQHQNMHPGYPPPPPPPDIDQNNYGPNGLGNASTYHHPHSQHQLLLNASSLHALQNLQPWGNHHHHDGGGGGGSVGHSIGSSTSSMITASIASTTTATISPSSTNSTTDRLSSSFPIPTSTVC